MISDVVSHLRAVGFEAGPAGTLSLSGPALQLRDAWLRYLEQLVAPLSPERFESPLFLTEDVLSRAGYFEHFPQHVMVATSFNDASAERRFVAPAACLHLYSRLSDLGLGAEPFKGFIVARCARHEGGRWEFPFRSVEFHMAEFVVVGREQEVVGLYEQAQEMLRGIGYAGLAGKVRVATDAFFLGNDDGARIMQKLKELKKEYVVTVAGQEVAVASLNRHEDYFARHFNLSAGGDERIESFCLAFGLERLTACGLLLWGGDPANWPAELR